MKTIGKLWRGEIDPFENSVGEQIEVKKLAELMESNRKIIYNSLNEEGRAALARYDFQIAELQSREMERTFEKGFSLGVKLTSEALLDN